MFRVFNGIKVILKTKIRFDVRKKEQDVHQKVFFKLKVEISLVQ
jgi:hypothetical protein